MLSSIRENSADSPSQLLVQYYAFGTRAEITELVAEIVFPHNFGDLCIFVKDAE